jgi:hypothetical protein
VSPHEVVILAAPRGGIPVFGGTISEMPESQNEERAVPMSEMGVLEALEAYQARTVAILDSHPEDPRGAVESMVGLHLQWVGEDPDRAREVISKRDAVATGELGSRLAESNRNLFEAFRLWLDRQVEAGRLGNGSLALWHATIFAPTHEITRHWLGGRLPRPLEDYEAPLKAAAWAGVTSLPSRSD